MPYRKTRALAVALGVAVCIGIGPQSALAQTSGDRELGQQIALALIVDLGFDAQITAAAAKGFGSAGEIDQIRPGWSKIMADSLAAEVLADRDAISRIFGDAMAGVCTHDELAAGLAMVRDPDFAAHSGGKTVPQAMDPATNPAVARAVQSAGGRGFLEKLGSKAIANPQVTGDVFAAILPGWFRRTGDAMAADEKARAVARAAAGGS
jgi:hypothetical protein